MMIQNALTLLQELSEIEEVISQIEGQILSNSLEIDMEEILQKTLTTYRKQRD